MNEIPGLVYKSPNVFSAKQRFVLAIVPPIAAFAYKSLAATAHTEVRDADRLHALVKARGHAIVAIWHEALGLAACHFRNTGYHTLTSYSFDGELAARVVRQFGMFALRGSSSRGGTLAIKSLEQALQHVNCVGFTLDGPRGPRRVAKPGIAILSARSKIPVISAAFAIDSAWRTRSWDKFPIPKPRARVIVAFGEPIEPPAGDSADEVEQMRLRVEQDLNALHRKAEDELGMPPII